MSLITSRSAKQPLLKPLALANGTIPSRDLKASRRFYEEVLGLEVTDHDPDGLIIRLGGDHTYLVEQAGDDVPGMVLLNHNGLFLDAGEGVDDAYAKLTAAARDYDIRQLTKPMYQHGSYAFFMLDADLNWWEFYHPAAGPRLDLTDGPQMTADEVRAWFQARRERDEAATRSSAGVAPTTGNGQVGRGLLRTSMLSHGTVESLDLHASRRFYEEVLGLNVRQLVPVSIHFDLGDGYMYAAVHAPGASGKMPVSYRNALLFSSAHEIDDAYSKVVQVQDEYGLSDIGRPAEAGDRYAFSLRDRDGNVWELAFDVHGGYHRPVR